MYIRIEETSEIVPLFLKDEVNPIFNEKIIAVGRRLFNMDEELCKSLGMNLSMFMDERGFPSINITSKQDAITQFMAIVLVNIDDTNFADVQAYVSYNAPLTSQVVDIQTENLEDGSVVVKSVKVIGEVFATSHLFEKTDDGYEEYIKECVNETPSISYEIKTGQVINTSIDEDKEYIFCHRDYTDYFLSFVTGVVPINRSGDSDIYYHHRTLGNDGSIAMFPKTYGVSVGSGLFEVVGSNDDSSILQVQFKGIVTASCISYTHLQ